VGDDRDGFGRCERTGEAADEPLDTGWTVKDSKQSLIDE
jgi:hypothetical protein